MPEEANPPDFQCDPKKGKKCAGNRLRGIPVPGMKYTSCYGYVFYFCFSSFSNKIRAF